MTVWRKSTHSGGNGSDCVEVTTAPNRVLVRDTKHRDGPVLTFTSDSWHHFATTLTTTRQG